MADNHLKPGEKVIFRKSKHTARPGRRARHVTPEPLGEYYTYVVDKYWVVADVDEDCKKVTVVTRCGKRHHLNSNDPRLRRPTWWERIRYATRFPQLVAGLPAAS